MTDWESHSKEEVIGMFEQMRTKYRERGVANEQMRSLYEPAIERAIRHLHLVRTEDSNVWRIVESVIEDLEAVVGRGPSSSAPGSSAPDGI